ncbi:hypothetical protein NPIL_580421 [Nephila pilipes]|uniref:Uncharacterized protein n=1 Tax=Nephila pilipes TaxID=299642 RepID=A0A8X6MAL9_NEPPI|nr:hypothetical protein NPIL_580421 [Nephila pilipes]
MTSSGIGDQPVNKKDLMRERFEYLLKKHWTKGRGSWTSIKRTPYESLFGCVPRFGLPTISIPSEMFDVVEDEYKFENASTALTVCFESEDDAVIVKEVSLNETRNAFRVL